MANPIQKNDLISDDALRALEEMSRLLREDKENMDALMASFKQYAGSIQTATTANNGNNDALAAALQKVSELEKAYSDLQKLMKENAATQRSVAAEKRKYAKLTADEAESVKRLSENVETYIRLTNSQTQSIKGLAEVYAKNIVEIDIQKKSYNELYQTYNALKDALNKMTVEERLNTEAGKKLTEQSLKIRDTLNELQKSTGNYTLQVGKYRAAFDGLGYSIQQVIREVPSALNINQFFLAISNNIPLVMDQIKAFNKEQQAINENLAQMTKGTKEYQDEAAKQISLGKKIKNAIFSWQSAVIGVLLILRQIDFDKLWKGFNRLIGITKDWWNEARAVKQELNGIKDAVMSAIEPARLELQLLLNDLKNAKRGTQEWENILYRIEEITGKTLDHTNDQVDAISNVTKAYIDQLKQIETNKAVVERYGNLFRRRYALENIFKGGGDSSLLSWLGDITDDDKEDLEEALDELRDVMEHKRIKDIFTKNQSLKSLGVTEGDMLDLFGAYLIGDEEYQSEIKKIVDRIHQSPWSGKVNLQTGELIPKEGISVSKAKSIDNNRHSITRLLNDLKNSFESFYEDVPDADLDEGVEIVQKELKKVKAIINRADNIFNEMYKAIPTSFVRSNGSSGSSASGSFNNSYESPLMAEVLEAEAEALKDKGDTVLEEIKLWYDKQVAIANAAYEKEKEDIERDKKDKEESLRENVLNAQKYVSDYSKIISDLDKKYSSGKLTEDQYKAQKAKYEHMYEEATELLKKAVKDGKIEESEEWMTIQRWASARENAAMLEHQNQLTDLVQQEQEKRAKVYVDGAKREAKAVESQFKHSGTLEEMEQYAAQMQEVINKLVEMSKAEEYGETAMNVFTDGLANMNNQLETMNENIDKKKLSDIEQHYKELTKVVHNRVKTINDEKLKNEDLTHNIDILKQKLKELTDEQMRSGKGDEKKAQDIEKVRQAIERLQQQISHTKQLANYTDLGDIFKRNVNVGSGTQRNIMEAILGKDAYKAFEGDDEALKNAIAKDFDEWADNAMSAVSTWYSTTMGYINDLISAYVELANAKAEAAAEATEAAQEEYDKEKALLEAGYASRVEATWAEYQEKKAAQEKAEADAKAAAQSQKELNEISTAGNMIVAASNIWKTFSAMGPLGMAAAAAAITAMFGAFIQSKIKASEVSKYGEGGFEVLEGGSHSSGHDIDLGVKNRKGRRMRAEGKEGLGIFRIRAMNHYGADNIEGWVNSINRLEFEGNAAKRMSLERSVGMAVLSAPRTDLRRLESSVDKLVGYGSRSRTVNADGSVTEIRKNAKIVYKNG